MRPVDKLRYARILVVAGIALGLVLAYRAGAFEPLGDAKSLARTLVAMGGWGHLAFVLAYAMFQPFGVPGTIFIVAAPLIWPWRTAFALSMTGTILASVVGFSFARFVARDWVAARIPAWLRKYDAAVERHAFRTVFLLRLIFWMPPPLHAFFGVSKVPFWTHFWGSLLGYLPTLLVISYLGSAIIDASGRLQPRAGLVVLGLLATSALTIMLMRHHDRRQRARGA